MKLLCERCGKVGAPGKVSVEGDVLVMACAHCGAESRSGGETTLAEPAHGTPLSARPVARAQVQSTGQPSARASAGAPSLLAVPEGRCPKCIAVRPKDATACAACGLVFENYRPDEFELSAAVEEGWRVTVAHWQEPARHDALVNLALHDGSLVQVGRLYRICLARDPNDLMAQRGRDEVLKRATLPASAPPRAPEDTERKKRLTLYTLLAFTLCAMAFLFWAVSGSRG